MATSATDLRLMTVPGTLQEPAGAWVVIDIPKAVVVLTRREFLAGLRRGKAYRRRQAFEARHRPEG
jgi:hypothetical protein